MNNKIFYFALLIMSLGFFSACSDDDEVTPVPTPDYATEVAGTYKGNMNVKIPSLEFEQTSLRKILLSKSETEKVKLELREFSFPIDGVNETQVGNIVVDKVPVSKDGEVYKLAETTADIELMDGLIKAKATVSGTITGKKINMVINVTEATVVETVNVAFEGDKMDADNEKTEALITKMTIESDLITEQPVIDGNKIMFYVSDNATIEDLKSLIPTIEISEGATINPESGKAIDFSENNVTFTVTAEDGIHKTVYTATWANRKIYDFEDWTETGVNKTYRLDPVGWATSNLGASTIIATSKDEIPFPIMPTDVSHSGEKAISITTVDTKGKGLYPKITAGSAYLGTFSLNIFDQLSSTKFGIPFTNKPLKVKGFYKYKAGDEFYDGKIVAEGKDSFAISAVLYEISKDTETLTGHDIYTSEKIVAKTIFESGEAKTEYTPFELELKYDKEKPYDPAKTYKFTVIFSSSKDGAAFKGAIGSTLIIDDVEIISE